MAIYAICLVKNEADTIAQTLAAASKWADRIYVLDNGSDDGTWEIVNAVAEENAVVVPFRQNPGPFRDSMRNEIFREFRHYARRGDWWNILDADEFYVDDPREFLRGIPTAYNSVWLAAYNFRFTDVDLAAYEANPRRFDGSSPWNQVLRYYVLEEYSEYRFFRHWWGLRSLPPANWGPIYPDRIRFRHYRYRSPEQIMRRLSTRQRSMELGEFFLHEDRRNWPSDNCCDGEFSWWERVVPSSSCYLDTGDAELLSPRAWQPPLVITRPSPVRLVANKIRKFLS